MMMAGNSTCVGEEWTWNIVIETMNKLTIEIKNPADTKLSGEDKMRTKEKKEELMEASHSSSITSQAPFHPVEFPQKAIKDPSKTSNRSMKKFETVPPSDTTSSSSLFKNFDPLQLEEERKRKHERYRSSYSLQMRTHRFTSSSTSLGSRQIPTRVQQAQAGNGGGRRAGAAGGRK